VAVAQVPQEIAKFLKVATPTEWLDCAVSRLDELLHDHANCELKAASTAMAIIYRYPARTQLVDRMSRLAREELRHFEQVRKILADDAVPFTQMTASRYAGKLHRQVRSNEPDRLLDTLLIGAIIEARSCERFALLVPRLPKPIASFYAGLLASEARHFQHYLELAESESGLSSEKVQMRLNDLLDIDAALVTSTDSQFRFHSGVPAAA